MVDHNHEGLRKFIPLDKCWILRLGVLDILNGRQDHIANEISSWERLRGEKSISKDIRALRACARNWDDQSMVVQVADCRTLYCYLKYASWKTKDMRSYLVGDDLLMRGPHSRPDIIGWNSEKLMTLEGGTTQWASAAILSGDITRLFRPPPHLILTYRAYSIWKASTTQGHGEYGLFNDGILFQQAKIFWSILREDKDPTLDDFIPKKNGTFLREPLRPEHYFMMRAFGITNMLEGKRQFPYLSYRVDRIADMERQLANLSMGNPIDSRDHRIVQAIAMKAMKEDKDIRAEHADCVDKSWPAFWEFLQHVAS